jgi:hypothetical protein
LFINGETSYLLAISCAIVWLSPKVRLLAKSETSAIQGQHALVNSVRQSAGPRENDFASSLHEWHSPPRMKIPSGYFHVSIKSAHKPGNVGEDCEYNRRDMEWRLMRRSVFWRLGGDQEPWEEDVSAYS